MTQSHVPHNSAVTQRPAVSRLNVNLTNLPVFRMAPPPRHAAPVDGVEAASAGDAGAPSGSLSPRSQQAADAAHMTAPEPAKVQRLSGIGGASMGLPAAGAAPAPLSGECASCISSAVCSIMTTDSLGAMHVQISHCTAVLIHPSALYSCDYQLTEAGLASPPMPGGKRLPPPLPAGHARGPAAAAQPAPAQTMASSAAAAAAAAAIAGGAFGGPASATQCGTCCCCCCCSGGAPAQQCRCCRRGCVSRREQRISPAKGVPQLKQHA